MFPTESCDPRKGGQETAYDQAPRLALLAPSRAFGSAPRPLAPSATAGRQPAKALLGASPMHYSAGFDGFQQLVKHVFYQPNCGIQVLKRFRV